MSTATLYTPTGAEPWILGVDFGTTYTCAAVREGDQIRELHLDGSTRMPSAVLLDGENIVVGRAAESRAPLAPECFERTPKRYMQACDEGILLGATYVPITKLVGAVLRSVWEEALAQHGGRIPKRRGSPTPRPGRRTVASCSSTPPPRPGSPSRYCCPSLRRPRSAWRATT